MLLITHLSVPAAFLHSADVPQSPGGFMHGAKLAFFFFFIFLFFFILSLLLRNCHNDFPAF